MLPAHMCGLSGNSSLFPLSKNMHVMVNDDFKFIVEVSRNMHGYFSCTSLCLSVDRLGELSWVYLASVTYLAMLNRWETH